MYLGSKWWAHGFQYRAGLVSVAQVLAELWSRLCLNHLPCSLGRGGPQTRRPPQILPKSPPNPLSCFHARAKSRRLLTECTTAGRILNANSGGGVGVGGNCKLCTKWERAAFGVPGVCSPSWFWGPRQHLSPCFPTRQASEKNPQGDNGAPPVTCRRRSGVKSHLVGGGVGGAELSITQLGGAVSPRVALGRWPDTRFFCLSVSLFFAKTF